MLVKTWSFSLSHQLFIHTVDRYFDVGATHASLLHQPHYWERITLGRNFRRSSIITLFYVVLTSSPKIPLEKKSHNHFSLVSCGLVLYSSSTFQRCAQLFLEPNIRREATSWIGWPYGSPNRGCFIESTTSSSSSGKGDDDAIIVDKKADWRCTILLLQSTAMTI